MDGTHQKAKYKKRRDKVYRWAIDKTDEFVL